jgi:hypothetical protein
MKFECTCGATIHDAGDGQRGKAHIVPDAVLHPLLDAFDELILARCATEAGREAACTQVRSLLIQATRQAWQCAGCGRLYVDDAGRKLNAYTPEGGASKAVFA